MSNLARYLELYDEIMDRMPKADRHLLEELDSIISVRDLPKADNNTEEKAFPWEVVYE